MEQLISWLRVALVDIVSSLLDSEGGVIPVSEVCELLIKVHDILDNAVSKQIGNSAGILAQVFNSAFRQHYEIWTSQFPFLHGLKDLVPPIEACLYGCINWSLEQAHQQSSLGLSQSFLLREVAKQDQGLGSISVCKRDLYWSLVVPLWLRGLIWRVGLRLIQMVGSLLVVVFLSVLLMLRRRGAMRVGTDLSQSTTSSSSLSSVLQVGMLWHFWINGEALLPTGLCLIWFRVTISCLGHICPCSIISGSSMLRQPQLIMPLFRRKWMSCLLRE